MSEKMSDVVNNNFLLKRIHQNIYTAKKNFCFNSVGGVGDGKSWGSMRILQDLDPDFSVDRICFSVNEMLSLLDSEKLSVGSGLLLDEAAGSSGAIDARQFMSKENEILSYLITTFRKLRLVTGFVMPHLLQVDKRARLVGSSAILVWNGVSVKNNYSRCRIYWSLANPISGKAYTILPRIVEKDSGLLTICDEMRVPPPSKDLTDAYEKKKSLFIKNQIHSWNAELDAKAESSKSAGDLVRSCVKSVLLDVERFKNTKGLVDARLILAEFDGLTVRNSGAVALICNKRGEISE